MINCRCWEMFMKPHGFPSSKQGIIWLVLHGSLLHNFGKMLCNLFFIYTQNTNMKIHQCLFLICKLPTLNYATLPKLCSVVCAQQKSPHIDSQFCNKLLTSCATHTGNEPYHTQVILPPLSDITPLFRGYDCTTFSLSLLGAILNFTKNILFWSNDRRWISKASQTISIVFKNFTRKPHKTRYIS